MADNFQAFSLKDKQYTEQKQCYHLRVQCIFCTKISRFIAFVCWSSQLYQFSLWIFAFCDLGLGFFVVFFEEVKICISCGQCQPNTIWQAEPDSYNTNCALPPALLVLLYPCWLLPGMDFKLSSDKNPECQTCRMSFPLSFTRDILNCCLLPVPQNFFFSSVWMHVCEELYLIS